MRAFRSAILNEALRIHPSTGLILERNVPKGGVTLHGKYIAENTIIGVNCWVVNRDKGIFGADADIFRPERWIESDSDTLQRMKRNMFTVSFTLESSRSFSHISHGSVEQGLETVSERISP